MLFQKILLILQRGAEKLTAVERLKSYEPLWENWYFDSYISRGASASVYRFKQDRFGKKVFSAVKVITISDSFEVTVSNRSAYMEEIKKRAEAEIENMYLLKDCPYVMHCNNYVIKDVRDKGGNIKYIDVLIQMDLYKCLADYLAEYEELSVRDIFKLGEQIGTALREIHRYGIIHRDIKPSNIFINEHGDFLLGDLGISKRFSENLFLTRAGTEPYAAPEIWQNNGEKAYTTSADIYSLGIVLYMLLNDNYLPFVNEGSSLSETTEAICRRLSGDRFEMPKYGSDQLKEVVMKACEYDAEKRYSNIGDFLIDIKIANSIYAQCMPPCEFRNNGTLIINSFGNLYYKDFINETHKLIISESIKEIPQGAFRGFKMCEVIFPHSLEIINNDAFERCKFLERVVFPPENNLKEIKKKAFSMCISLHEIDFSNCEQLKNIENRAFWYCGLDTNIIMPNQLI